MTYYDYFEFFYKILHHLIAIIRCEQSEVKVKTKEIDLYAASLNYALRLLYNTSTNKSTVKIPSTKNEITILNYDLPKPQEHPSVSYLCPILFTSLHLDSFFTILCNLLIEHSMIFISDDLNVLTSSM